MLLKDVPPEQRLAYILGPTLDRPQGRGMAQRAVRLAPLGAGTLMLFVLWELLQRLWRPCPASGGISGPGATRRRASARTAAALRSSSQQIVRNEKQVSASDMIQVHASRPRRATAPSVGRVLGEPPSSRHPSASSRMAP